MTNLQVSPSFAEEPTNEELLSDAREVLYARAIGLLTSAQPRAAEQAFLALALAYPNDPRFYMGAGMALHHLQRYDAAFLAYDTALALDPSEPVAPALRAECALFAMPRAEAMSLLDAVVQAPAHPIAAPYVARLRRLRFAIESTSHE